MGGLGYNFMNGLFLSAGAGADEYGKEFLQEVVVYQATFLLEKITDIGLEYLGSLLKSLFDPIKKSHVAKSLVSFKSSASARPVFY